MKKSNLKSILLIFFISFFSIPLNAITVTVNNTNDAGVGSLREAIAITNTTVGNDYINFNLGVGGPFTITLLSALPALTDNAGVFINGWDNAGNPGTPNSIAIFSTSIATPLNPVYKIILGNGNNIPVGLTISSSNNLIQGLVLNDFGDGTPSANDMCISLAGSSNTIIGCYLGMADDGSTMGAKPYYGIYCTRANNLIGDGTNAGVNLISGMGGSGGVKIYFAGATATANIVRGNIIGLQSNGTSALTASSTGIYLLNPANSNTIGGTGAFDGNLISGNRGTGIVISSYSNVIQGNFIGPLSDGITGLVGTQQSNGMSNSGWYNLIGGSAAGARNVIAGNPNLGMDMSGRNNIIQGNYWGTNKLGTGRLIGVGGSGMAVNTGTGNLIGGPGPGEGNLISGASNMGIWVLNQATNVGNTIQQNTIGLAVGATASLTGGGNSTGILMSPGARGNIIGGNSANTRNIISGNTTGISMGGAYVNTITGNYIGPSGDGLTRVIGTNQTYGISMSNGSLNAIGNTGAGDGNVISGNTSYGIYMSAVSASLNTIVQNTIGPNPAASGTLTNATNQTGVYMSNAKDNVVGGSGGASTRNIISANSNGVVITGATATNNVVRGNYIGLAGDGINRIIGSTQSFGVQLNPPAFSNTIGGLQAGEGNVMSGNSVGGYYGIGNTVGNAYLGNIIGLQANGLNVVTGATQSRGMDIHGSGLLIGDIGGYGNIISGNTNIGIYNALATGSNNIIRANHIGPGINGLQVAGAVQATGIQLQQSVSNYTVGGYLGAVGQNPQGNRIAFNTGNGVNVTSTPAVGHMISRNLIYSNGVGATQFPINLNYGVNQGNNGKPAPDIVTYTTSIVTGSGAVTAGVGDTVEVFANTSGNCKDMSIYKGSTLADAVGNWTLTGITINPGESVLATARSLANNNTSQTSTCTVPLPVEVVAFSAFCMGNKVNVYWTTITELNSKIFRIERSVDGVNFERIGELAAAGHSTQKLNYTLVDEHPLKETVYYKLIQEDISGLIQEFILVYTNDCDAKSLTNFLFPNPANSNVNLVLPGFFGREVKIEIISVLGKVEKSIILFVETPLNEIDIADLSKGVYFVRLLSADRNEVLRLTID
ncbi:MAG: T9SS type A sorting domain-containing protein [Sphingobacteriaceae bacterium]|nr:T9SS type A sorting domain-containing protein [Sphingobacteriaceae bacterium]